MGNPDAEAQTFEVLYRKHHAAVLAFAQRRAPAVADEIVNRVFTYAWQQMHHIPANQQRPWLYGVTRNFLLAEWRAERRRDRLHSRLRAIPGRRPPEPADAIDETLNPRIKKVLSQLTESEREILLLVAWEGLSSAEIALVIGCREGTARVRVHRARKRAQNLYENLREDRDSDTTARDRREFSHVD